MWHRRKHIPFIHFCSTVNVSAVIFFLPGNYFTVDELCLLSFVTSVFFYFVSFLRNIFAGYRSLSWQLRIFSILKMLSHALSSSIIFSEEATVSNGFAPLNRMHLLNLCALEFSQLLWHAISVRLALWLCLRLLTLLEYVRNLMSVIILGRWLPLSPQMSHVPLPVLHF